MPEIHYTDAILTVAFSGGLMFMVWSVKQFQKIDKHLIKMEKQFSKQLRKANRQGAKMVKQYFELLNRAPS